MTFVILRFFPKTNERITFFFCWTVVKTNFLIHFLEEFEGTKKSFWNYLTFSSIQIENYIAALAHSCAPLHTLVNSTTFEASNFKFSAFCHDHDSINETQRLIFHTVTGHCNLHAPLTTPTTADFYQNT